MKFHGKWITLSCRNEASSLTFYRDVLGGEPLPGDLGCRRIRLGDLELSLMPNAEAASPAEFPRDAMPILYLEVEDLAEAEKRLAAIGWPVDEVTDVYLMVRDPDGLYLEIFEKEPE